MKNHLSAAAALSGACFLTLAMPATAAFAATTNGDVGYGVSAGGNRLITFDPLNPGAAGQGTPISGLSSGETVVAIDTRPSTGMLDIVTDDSSGNGRLYSLDPSSAVATPIGTTIIPLATDVNGAHFDIDFNPVVDKIRLVSSKGLNLRIDPTTGAVTTDTSLAYASGDANAGKSPHVAGAAYTGAVGAASTSLYDIDYVTNTLDLQGSVNGSPTSPNSGTLTTVGGLTIDPSNLLGFDISPRTGTAYLAAQVVNEDQVSSSSAFMYTVNLSSGVATPVASVDTVGSGSNSDLLETFCVGPAITPPASLPDFAMPAVAGLAALAAGGAVLTFRRRQRLT